ncbi:TraB/GumN family protein [Sphingomonas flavalba]|uniref:TraB/GumN family protein n=1 Tax=Sphingomonas flavalba TaxID=2559804 RepID=UPI00109DB95A|nr:TraB/GumN family protein [Sphingomonas flavalba]
MSRLFRLLAPVAALLISACAGSGQAESARPALWRVSDPDTTIYLFGTIHMLPSNYRWRTAKFDAALARTDTLVMEIADVGNAAGNAEAYRAVATAAGLPPILDRVPADKRAALQAAIDKVGLKPAQLDRLKTWAAALAIGGASSAATGASPANGVDKQLGKLFGDAGKPILGLETTAQQLAYFDTLPEDAQRQLLTGMLDGASGEADDVTRMIRAWGRGDVRTIAVTFDEELKLSLTLADRLIRQRNTAWTAWIEQRLATPGIVMVAVGAGHLAGKDSVLEMLKAKGLKVERLQ